ncbi:MAG: dTDP-4-dehydrorhamnose 3,5-epimerase [Armatimonadetes bacterium]|nr:dTDP-4-dehydrorhamnose 3,5-epimerase [Armatimonadota bacterium]
MNVIASPLPGVLVIEPRVHGDARGFFLETFNEGRYAEHGIHGPWVQDNLSKSAPGVLRGLHYQWPEPQGKLVSVVEGEVWDVAVDIRRGSPTFGQWYGTLLDAESHRQLWVPPGFAHGFVVTQGPAVFAYKCTAPYRAEYDAGVAWDDPDLAVDWPSRDVQVSDKDAKLPRLKDIAEDRLPVYGV